MTTKEISFAVKITPKLVQEYEKILEEYASQNIEISELLKYEPHIENNIEIFANEYGKEAKQ